MKQVIALALVISFGSGCSWLISRPPTAGEQCRHNYFSPIFDASQAVGAGLIGVWGLGYSQEKMHADHETIGFIGLIAAGEAVVWAASAHYGFKNVRKCRERDEAEQRQRGWVTPSIRRPIRS